MGTDMDDLFDDFESANPAHKSTGNKIKVAGTHLVKVLDVRMQPSEMVATDYFVVEFEIIESTHAEIRPGEHYSWTCDPKRKFGKNKVGQNDIKQFIAAVAGFDPNDEEAKSRIGKKHLEMVLNQGEAEGEIVQVETVPKTARESKRDWTQHLWSPHPSE